MKKFIPENFNIPIIFETEKLRLRMLSINDVVLDYDAVMSSVEHLQKAMSFGPDNKWPSKQLTFEQDLIDLGWHQKEFQNRSSFAYTVMSLDEKICLGCVYIYPSPNDLYDAQVVMWVRQSVVNEGLDEYLFKDVKKWILEKWAFEKPGYPGREISWESWNKLKE